MAISFGPKLGLLFNANINESYVDAFRPFLQALDQLVNGSVINSTTVVPPVSPNAGDAYLISSTPSGAWATFPVNSIAVWDTQVTNTGTNVTNPQWVNYVPNAGWLVWNVATTTLLVYNGSAWIAAAGSGAVASVFGRTGAVVAQSGDYAVGQVTGAAPTIPVSYLAQDYSGQAINFTSNSLRTFNLTLTYPITVSNIGYDLTTDDTSGSNTYSISIYNSSGNLVATTGALVGSTFSPGTGFQHQAIIGAPVTLPAGQYVIGIACSSATAVLGGKSESFSPIINVNSATTTGSVPPSTITFPSASWGVGYAPAICLY